MQLAISIPQLDTGTVDALGVKAYLARAEELGFEAGWVMEQSIGPTPLIAPLEMLAYGQPVRIGSGSVLPFWSARCMIHCSLPRPWRRWTGLATVGWRWGCRPVVASATLRRSALTGNVRRTFHRGPPADEGRLV